MNNSYFGLMKASWEYSKNSRLLFVLIYFLFFCSSILNSLNPIIFGKFIGDLSDDQSINSAVVFQYILLYLLLQFLYWVFHGPARMIENKISIEIAQNYLDSKLNGVLGVFQEKEKANVLGMKIFNASDSLRLFFSNGFSYFQTIVQFVLSVIVILHYSWVFGLISLLFGVLLLLVIVKFDRFYVRRVDEFKLQKNDFVGRFLEVINKNSLVLLFDRSLYFKSRLLKDFSLAQKIFLNSEKISELKWFTSSLIMALIYVFVIYGYFITNKDLSSSEFVTGLVVLVGFVTQFNLMFYNLASLYSGLIQYYSDFKIGENIECVYRVFLKGANTLPQENFSELYISNLEFSYSPTSMCDFSSQDFRLVVKGFSLYKQSKVFISGGSGNGKTTFFSILSGLLYPFSNFNVNFNQVKIDSFDVVSKNVLLLNQESQIFNDSIHFNITLGLNFSKEEIDEACCISGLNSMLDVRRISLSTQIFEDGKNLSGGEKQRICIARGLLFSKFYSIIIFDESVSNLNESLSDSIIEGIFSYLSDKCLIFSSHRDFSKFNFSDKYVLKNGCLFNFS